MSTSTSSSHGHLFKLITLVALTLVIGCSATWEVSHNTEFYWRKIHVHVENDITPNKMMELHCKSKDDDLGLRSLEYKESFSWKFKINFSKTTLFFCYMGWNGTDGKLVQGSFEIYSAKRDRTRCGTQCYWSARKDGVFSPSSEGYQVMYPWPTNSTLLLRD
ncbi:Plant self-incompatibility S1 [Macleaya cordata]|uniref:S-protein homolog n=1 Tax=Macleaya cordata TaxID=56857 RepID=A0A200R790_MACCD|nr:Plant self-incompatibility S1 [Macleaya cordata]